MFRNTLRSFQNFVDSLAHAVGQEIIKHLRSRGGIPHLMFLVGLAAVFLSICLNWHMPEPPRVQKPSLLLFYYSTNGGIPPGLKAIETYVEKRGLNTAPWNTANIYVKETNTPSATSAVHSQIDDMLAYKPPAQEYEEFCRKLASGHTIALYGAKGKIQEEMSAHYLVAPHADILGKNGNVTPEVADQIDEYLRQIGFLPSKIQTVADATSY